MTLAEKWRQQGLEKGLQQGIQQGVQQGMEKGAYETSCQIALSMLQKKLPLDVIEEVTGLSESEVKSLLPRA